MCGLSLSRISGADNELGDLIVAVSDYITREGRGSLEVLGHLGAGMLFTSMSSAVMRSSFANRHPTSAWERSLKSMFDAIVGTFGQVLKVRNADNTVFALKVIRNRHAFRRQAQTEIELLQCLKLPETTIAGKPASDKKVMRLLVVTEPVANSHNAMHCADILITHIF